jgi:hemerythrin-like domain-containing protein
MRIINILQEDRDLAARFLAVLGRGLTIAGQGKSARPGFFIFATGFIHEYLEAIYFKKEKVLLDALESCGFPHNDGPVAAMNGDVEKSYGICNALFDAAKRWQGGDETGRADVIWATSEYSGILHHHFDMLKSLIHPLLEQSLSPDDEENAAEALNRLAFQGYIPENNDNFVKMLETLEEEVTNWKG